VLASTKDTSTSNTDFNNFSSSGRRTPIGLLRQGKLMLIPRMENEGDFIGLVDVYAKHEKASESSANSRSGIAVKSGISVTEHYRY
jgi:hypothetical protein